MKAAQPSLFGGPAVPVKISTTRGLKGTEAALKKLATGVHPATDHALLDDGSTCSSCTQITTRKAKWLCVTKSRNVESTWPACVLYNPKDDQ